VINFDNVTKVYPNQNRPALENVNIEVAKGEFVFLVGPSGSGKSTFLRLVLKEERPTDGRIHVAGRDLARLSNWKVPYLRRRIGCVFQDFRLLPNKNVYQNVAFALEVIGKHRRFIRKVVPEVIDLVGLEGKHDRMPDELSGGTFTITNIGSQGALTDTPILVPPQAAMLGTGAIVKRPRVVVDASGNESIGVRSVCYLPLTYDHRLIDGADAGRFLTTIKHRLEEAAFEADLGL